MRLAKDKAFSPTLIYGGAERLVHVSLIGAGGWQYKKSDKVGSCGIWRMAGCRLDQDIGWE